MFHGTKVSTRIMALLALFILPAFGLAEVPPWRITVTLLFLYVYLDLVLGIWRDIFTKKEPQQ